MSDEATRIYNGPECAHWSWRKYRVTTYPGSNRIHIVIADTTHKAVYGWRIDMGAREAIKRALGKRWSIHTSQDGSITHLGIITAYDLDETHKRARSLWPMFHTFMVLP